MDTCCEPATMTKTSPRPAPRTGESLAKDAAAVANVPAKLDAMIAASWEVIAPFWPLAHLAAVNPLHGLTPLPIEEALARAAGYFERPDLPHSMQTVNRETIKWLGAFCDQGQATIAMPNRERGLFAAWRALAPYDTTLGGSESKRRAWLQTLPEEPQAVIGACLEQLGIPGKEQQRFLTLMLTTLPGWAAHVQYRSAWRYAETAEPHPLSHTDYLALRLALTCRLWPEARTLLDWHREGETQAAAQAKAYWQTITDAEAAYRGSLLLELTQSAASLTQASPQPRQEQAPAETHARPQAQLIFCIDVRSEPFRRALESLGGYETYGFAGFFGVPARVHETLSGEHYASCPVLIAPQHSIQCHPLAPEAAWAQRRRIHGLKRWYQSLKYGFTTPFALAEMLGIANGLWMGLRTFAPAWAMRLKEGCLGADAARNHIDVGEIPLSERRQLSENALRLMGLTEGFAPVVVLCGHKSTTQNNAYATALDCGACGGRHGGPNARALSAMLNDPQVREHLATRGISIPEDTRFIGAEHNTTTDAVRMWEAPKEDASLSRLQADLEQARALNSAWRAVEALKASPGAHANAAAHTRARSQDWAQVRPEWGLARNAAFIVGPRRLTGTLDLQGRCFLHSYDWQQDPEGSHLGTILTAPMVVAQWINAQYLFSTLNPVAYGGGSKVTKNISGKVGVMQGNASDLMHGLPLQSVFSDDTHAYHEPQRLLTVAYAPRALIESVIGQHAVLQQLFGHGWVSLVCLEPEEARSYQLTRELTWAPL